MADVDFEDGDDGYGSAEARGAARGARLSQLVNLAGAASSVVLVIGLGVWGYRLAVRDVTGIPVIRAIEAPMRVAPENPGGEVAAHQGLAVNDVAASGTAAPPPETLILAPRAVELADEDAAAQDLNGAAPAAPQSDGTLAPVVAPEVAADLPAIVAPDAPPAEPQGADPDAVAKALAEALSTDTGAGLGEDGVADGVVDDLAALDPNPEASATIRPRQRPLDLAAAAPSELAPSELADTAPALAQTPLVPAPVAEVDAAMIAVGTRLVQLGAFDTEDQARAEWAKLTNRFGPAFAGKALVVQSAQSGGRVFFRLRAHGFADETEARSFCLTLLEQNAACIPVEQR